MRPFDQTFVLEAERKPAKEPRAERPRDSIAAPRLTINAHLAHTRFMSRESLAPKADSSKVKPEKYCTAVVPFDVVMAQNCVGAIEGGRDQGIWLCFL
jgi:hypothetical protein